MTIHIEFYGVARQRAGVASASLPLAGPVSLKSVIAHLQSAYPDFAEECLQGHSLCDNYVVNIDGHRFVRDMGTEIRDDACLLIMSADAGG